MEVNIRVLKRSTDQTGVDEAILTLIPQMRPFIMRVWPGKVCFSAVMVGVVSKPQAKNSANITISAWRTLGRPRPLYSWIILRNR